eukprot:gene27909-30966_t
MPNFSTSTFTKQEAFETANLSPLKSTAKVSFSKTNFATSTFTNQTTFAATASQSDFSTDIRTHIISLKISFHNSFPSTVTTTYYSAFFVSVSNSIRPT